MWETEQFWDTVDLVFHNVFSSTVELNSAQNSLGTNFL